MNKISITLEGYNNKGVCHYFDDGWILCGEVERRNDDGDNMYVDKR